jgi:K+-sensing histidine kinase KdpD
VRRARSVRRRERPFARVVLGVAPRERDATLIERASRLARRLGIGLRVVMVTARDDAAAAEARDRLGAAATSLQASFVAETAPDAAVRVVQLLESGDVLLVESPRKRRRLFFGRHSFAVRALAAGARELLVLVPRETSR